MSHIWLERINIFFEGLFHKHKWRQVFSSRWGTVALCDCGQMQTVMHDYSTGLRVLIKGNLLAASLTEYPIFILCGNQSEFQTACKTLIGTRNYLRTKQIRPLKTMRDLQGIRDPIILLYGSWYENEICENPELADAINGML